MGHFSGLIPVLAVLGLCHFTIKGTLNNGPFSTKFGGNVWVKKLTLFLGPKSRVLSEKSNFCHTNPILVNGPYVALGETVHFPRWERFFDSSFPSYSCFCKKKQKRLSCQKVFPLPTVGAPSASNSPISQNIS